MTTPIDDFTSEERDRFYRLVGRSLFQLPVTCVRVGRSTVLGTVRDCYDVEPNLDRVAQAAQRFLVELARAGTYEETVLLAARWHGSRAVGHAVAPFDPDEYGVRRTSDPEPGYGYGRQEPGEPGYGDWRR